MCIVDTSLSFIGHQWPWHLFDFRRLRKDVNARFRKLRNSPGTSKLFLLTLAPRVVKDGAHASPSALDSRQVQVLRVVSLSKPQAEYPAAVRRQESLHLVEHFGGNGGALDLPEEPFHVAMAIALFGQPPAKLVK
jgi:hypothetical protein